MNSYNTSALRKLLQKGENKQLSHRRLSGRAVHATTAVERPARVSAFTVIIMLDLIATDLSFTV